MIKPGYVISLVFWGGLFCSVTLAADPKNLFDDMLATINYAQQSRSISAATYRDAFLANVKSTYYHGKPPEGKEVEIRKEAWQKLVRDTLLVMAFEEAGSKIIEVENIQQKLDAYAKKNAASPNWSSYKDRVLKVVGERLRREAIYQHSKDEFFAKVKVSEAEIRDFYLKNPKLFTEPERNEVSIILISVAPSASSGVWEVAINQLKDIRKDIKTIDDFRKMAELYSTDSTAEQGGNMGILHEGQLGGIANETVHKLEVGAVSEPLILLEGVALLTVTRRIGATHHTFAEVKTRATQLRLREKRAAAWQTHLESMRTMAEIKNSQEIDALLGE